MAKAKAKAPEKTEHPNPQVVAMRKYAERRRAAKLAGTFEAPKVAPGRVDTELSEGGGREIPADDSAIDPSEDE